MDKHSSLLRTFKTQARKILCATRLRRQGNSLKNYLLGIFFNCYVVDWNIDQKMFFKLLMGRLKERQAVVCPSHSCPAAKISIFQQGMLKGEVSLYR